MPTDYQDDFQAEDDFIPDPVQPGGRRTNPFRLLDAARAVSQRSVSGLVSAATAPVNPFAVPGALAKPIAQLPAGAAAPTGAVLGGIAGSPFPFGATVGSGIGAALGRGIDLAKKDTGQPLQPGQAKETFRDMARTGIGTAGGTLIGSGVGKALGGVTRGARTLFSSKRQIDLAQRSRGALGETVKAAGREFEAGLKGIKGTVDLTGPINSLKAKLLDADAGPALRQALDRGIQVAGKIGDTTLKQVLDNPKLAKNLSPMQAQQMMNTLRQVPSVARLSGVGGKFAGKGAQFIQRASDTDLDLIQHAGEIKEALIQQFPEQFPQLGQKYAQAMDSFRKLSPRFREGSLVKNIMEGFRDPEVAQRVRQTLPADLVKEIFGVNKAKKIIGGVIGAGILNEGVKLFKKR